jgi:hypothetical protein
MADNLIKILREGPEVSFNGSPTVSPITAAACSLDPFFLGYPSTVKFPLSMNFLALSQAPPELALETAIQTPETTIPGKVPAIAIGPKITPIANGTPKQIAAGANNSLKEALVAMMIH